MTLFLDDNFGISSYGQTDNVFLEFLMRIFIFTLLISSFFLTGCSNNDDIQFFLKPEDATVAAHNYVLQPPDELEIHCSSVPEIHLSHHVIRPDGNISFEKLGSVPVAGKTPEQAADLIRLKVLELYSLPGDNPIEIAVKKFRSSEFYVLGEVSFPGPRVFTGRDTVLSVLAEARPTILAWEDQIKVIRPSGDKNIKAKIFTLDYKRMARKGDTSQNVLLQEGDIIYVPPTILAAIGKKVEEIVRPIGRAFSTVNIVQGPPQGGGN